MRTILIALAGLFVVAGVGATAIGLMPTSDHDPINSIRVEVPQGIQPIPPAPQNPSEPRAPQPSSPALSPPPAAVPPPADIRGVPEPPPAIWRDGDGDDDWDDDDWDDDDDDWDDDDDDDDD